MGHLDRCGRTGKVCYHFVEARDRARVKRRKGQRRCSEYRCPDCGFFHYGQRSRGR